MDDDAVVGFFWDVGELLKLRRNFGISFPAYCDFCFFKRIYNWVVSSVWNDIYI